MEEENENLSEEEVSEMKEYFDKSIWPKLKRDLKEMSKKEACFSCFVAGTDVMRYSQEEEIKNAEKELSKMKPEEIEKIIRGGVEGEESLWEDKTKVNGVLIDDKTGEVVGGEE